MPFNQQISGNNSNGEPILSVIAKRTYTINENGTCTLDDEQIPLTEELEFNENQPSILDSDLDIYPFKLFSDIIIKGQARTIAKTNTFKVSIEIDKQYLEINITGNRKLYKDTTNKLKFTEAELINEIPLTYNFAYGGKDLIAEKPYREKLENDEQFKHIKHVLNLLEGSPYRYPRNPEGKGYILETSDEALENFELPNLEDPYQLLTGENIVCRSIEDWHKMPLPIATNWVHPGWFPRVAYFGTYPIPESYTTKAIEIERGWVDEAILKSNPQINKSNFNFRSLNGASLGLQAKNLFGGETCRLINIHPNKSEFIFKLPKDTPTIRVDGRNGKLKKTTPTIHNIVIEPDKNRLSIVWCGSVKALRPYMLEELKTMPFEVKWN